MIIQRIVATLLGVLILVLVFVFVSFLLALAVTAGLLLGAGCGGARGDECRRAAGV